MPPRLIPEDPQLTTTSERVVWERLRDSLRPEDTLIASFRLTDEHKDHEIDLIAVMPDAGIVVIEVKGGGLTVRDGVWRMRHGDRERVIDPVRQAREARYALRRYVESDPCWRDSSRRRVRFAHAVVTPFVGLGADFVLPDCPRWMVHDREDLPDLATRLADIPLRQETEQAVPTADDCAVIVDVLTARGVDAGQSVVDDADEREVRADRLTQEQSQILGVTRLLRRVEVRGGAGSGKTVLALTQARQLAAGRDGRAPERVALLCYSIGLATWFTRVVATWPHRQRPAFVGTFEDLANRWGVPSGSRDDPDYWEETMPRLMAERAAALPPGERYDSFVVDEAQDFAESWWRPLVGALTDEGDGGLFIYSDENQRIFQRFGRPPVPLVPLVLDHNLRNTKQIAEVFKPLAPLRMRLEGGDGPEVVLVPTSPEDALAAADDQIDHLIDVGWSPRHIALLTTGKRHPVQVERQEELGQGGYWRTFWEEDDVFYGHVLGAKGMERRVVVLSVNEDGTRERFRERLYVGLSRATDHLVVVGDPEAIARAGDAVARALGAGGRVPTSTQGRA